MIENPDDRQQLPEEPAEATLIRALNARIKALEKEIAGLKRLRRLAEMLSEPDGWERLKQKLRNAEVADQQDFLTWIEEEQS